MGVSGSGKSTLGAELAQALGCPFLDGDAFHPPSSVAKMRAGTPLTDEDRWPWLDSLGQAVKAAADGQGIVVAACSALKRSYRDRLRQIIGEAAQFVLLQGEPGELRRRLSTRTGHYMPASLLSNQIATLEPPQPDEHVLMLDAQQPPAVLRDQVLDGLALSR
jgi:gluconokinase